MSRWSDLYRQFYPKSGEDALIVSSELRGGRRVGNELPSLFQASTGPIFLNRISKAELLEVYGRCPLTRLLVLLEKIDELASSVAHIPKSTLTVHHGIYGNDEMAHASPKLGYISVNVGHPRVRALLLGTMKGSPTAHAALMDLMLHEKAHIALPPMAPDVSHGVEFYEKKTHLKHRLLKALDDNKNRDPFRRIWFEDMYIPSIGELAARFSSKLLPARLEITAPKQPTS